MLKTVKRKMEEREKNVEVEVIANLILKNSQQKKFYYIKRAMMMGNIFIAVAVILYLSKEFLGA